MGRVALRPRDCYSEIVVLPFDRTRLAERSENDRLEEERASAAETPAERLALSLSLSSLSRALARGAGSRWVEDWADDLGEKARRCAAPLRLLVRR